MTLGETYKATALSTATLNLNGATFALPGGTVLGGLGGSGSNTLTVTGSNPSRTLSIGANNISSTFAGSFSGSGGSGPEIIKIGTGTWSLFGS